MSNPNEARIDVTARLDSLRAELAKMPDIGRAAAADMVRALNQQIKAAERAARDAARASQEAAKRAADTAASFRQAEAAAGRFGQAGAKLAGVLGLIDPRLAEVARAANDVGDAGEVAAQSTGALGISAGAAAAALAATAIVTAEVYAAYRIYNEESDRAARIAAEVTAAEAARAPILSTLRDRLLDLKVATGEMTAEQRELLKAADATFTRYGEATTATRARIAELRVEQAGVLTQLVDAAETVVPAWTPLGVAIDGLTTNTAEYDQELTALNSEVAKAVDLSRAEHSVTVAAAAALGHKASTTDAAAAAVRSLSAALTEANAAAAAEGALAERNATEYLRGAEALAALERQHVLATASAERRIELEREAALTAAESALRQQMVASETESARETARESYDAAVRAIDARYDADQETRRARELAAAAQAADTRRQTDERAAAAAMATGQQMSSQLIGYVQQGLGMASSALDSSATDAADIAQRLQDRLVAGETYYTAAQRAELEKRAQQAREQARRQFEAAKAAKLAEATAATALASINAIAQSPPPSPLGLIGAGLAAAAGATAMAAIGSTEMTLHGGGPVNRAPDETLITARSSEYMLNPVGRAMLGDDNAAALNAGMTPPATSRDIVVVQAYEHNQLVSRYKRDGLDRFDPVAQSIQARISIVGMEAS